MSGARIMFPYAVNRAAVLKAAVIKQAIIKAAIMGRVALYSVGEGAA